MHTYILFWSSIPLKAVKKTIQSKHSKLFEHILRICRMNLYIFWHRMNLFVYWDYAEKICMYMENMVNEVNLPMKFHHSYTENTWKLICLYAENMRNESVHILRICGMNLYVYQEYAECTKSQISRQIRNQNQKYFRSPDRFVWPNHGKPVNLMLVYL
jgi:hypothetical protein